VKRFYLLFSLAMLVGVGCDGGGAGSANSAAQTVSVRDQVEIQFPPGWSAKKETGPFDILWGNESSHLSTGLIVYDSSNPVPRSPDEALQFHLDELKRTYKYFQITQDKFEKKVDTRRFVRVLCTADNGNPAEVFPHRLTLVDFGDSKVFVVVVQQGTTQNFAEAEPALATITESIRLSTGAAVK
jgi:hypothetical protein